MAMIAGKSYAEVAASFPRVNPAENGMIYYHLFDFFADEGFACQKVNKYSWRWEDKEREVWPPPLIAEAAICMVDGGRGGEHSHGIVVIRDGRVFDPVHGERSWSDYPRVGCIYPLWDIR